MTQNLKHFKCVSSLVVFRKMYESRQSIYDIISEFAKTIIISHSLRTFELHEMCSLLKDEYGVLIVPAVVKTVLKRLSFLKREKNEYTLEADLSNKEVKLVTDQISQSKNSISEILDDYVEYKKVKGKTEFFDESVAKENFCKFIVDGDFVDESDIGTISAFIVERKGNNDFEQACKCIREGLIIYNGLSYTTEGELVEKLDTPFTVYMETEMLFHAVGLNGTLYQSLFDDFYQVVSDINKVTIKRYDKRIISLSYFSETKKEVNSYFAQAELIYKNQRKLDPSKPAMKSILNGCSSVADIKQKAIEFWNTLDKMRIREDGMAFDISNDYYSKYNLSVESDISDLGTCEDVNKVYDIGQMLSKINYIRRNTNHTIFRTIRAIILTGNRNTLSLSNKYTQPQNVPFATTLSYLTNRFWYSLNKGIFAGNSAVPGANIITMAQVAFSQKVNESLTSEYKKLKQQFDDGTITKENANEIIAGFKINYLQPENVTKEIVEENFCFDLFNGDAIEQAKAERFLEKKKHTEEIATKNAELAKYNIVINKLIKDRNEEEQNKYYEALNKYDKEKVDYIQKQVSRQWLKNITISILYLVIFLTSVILGYLNHQKGLAGILTIAFVAFPIVERYVRPFTNKFIEKAFVWIFSPKERLNFKENISEIYTKNNPQPKMILSTIESYYTK